MLQNTIDVIRVINKTMGVKYMPKNKIENNLIK